jgi:hypothetical protein
MRKGLIKYCIFTIMITFLINLGAFYAYQIYNESKKFLLYQFLMIFFPLNILIGQL